MSTVFGWKHLGKHVVIYEYVVVVKPWMISVGDHVQVDAHGRLEGGQGLTIGDYVHIADSAIINTGGGTTIIGAHAGIATGAKILSGQPDLSYLHICPNEPDEDVHPIRKITTICPYAFIAAGAIIMPGVTVSEGAVVAAGAVVTKDVDPWTIVAGIPAIMIGQREVRP